MNLNPLTENQSRRAVKSYPNIRRALYGQPLAISETGLDLVCGIFEAASEGLISDLEAQSQDDKKPNPNPELQWVDDVALISVMGPIFPRANLFTRVSGMTSAQGIMAAIDVAAAEKPSAYVFLFDSPGGSVSLGFECADKIYGLRSNSAPVWSVVQGNCCSLAYLWASQAERVFCGVDSMVGSISVVLRAMSDDRAMKNIGVDGFTIKSGNLKQMDDPATLAFANQYASLLTQVQTWHEMFVSSVQRGRASINAAQMATGEIWIGRKAVAAGIADEVSTLDEVLNQLT